MTKKQIVVDNLDVEVVRKRMKSLRIAVYPPDARVRISVPLQVTDRQIREVLYERLDWIKKHRKRILSRPQPPQLKFIDGESHYFLGKPLTLRLSTRPGRASIVKVDGQTIVMSVPGDLNWEARKKLLDRWYRKELNKMVPDLIAKWEPEMGVQVAQWGIRLMKTKWGTCNIRAHRIWLNLELAKYPPQCLEYVVVHEMVHLLERLHNARFKGFMDQFLPNWREIKTELNHFDMC